MTFNLLHDSTGTSISGSDELAGYFESTVYPTWLGGLSNYTVSITPGVSGTIAISRVANNSSEEVIDYWYLDLATSAHEHVAYADPDGDQLNLSSGLLVHFGGLLDDISGSATATAVVKLFQSNVDSRSWFMTLNGRIIGFDLGDNFYRYSPGASSQTAKQYYWNIVTSTSSTMDSDMRAFNIGDASTLLQYDVDPLHMNGLATRDNVESTFSTDVVTLGYIASSDINIAILGARSDVRQLRAATATPSVYSPNSNPPVYQDGSNYWATTSTSGLMFDCGTTEPLL